MFGNRKGTSTLKGMAAGAIGGAVASLAMTGFQAVMSKLTQSHRQQAQPRDREQQASQQKQQQAARGGGDQRADIKAAVAVSEAVFRHELAPEEKEPAAAALHYAFGTASGALYGVLAEHWEEARMGGGAAFGAAVWLLADETAVPAFGFSKGPQEYPLESHAKALAAHLVYGTATEFVRRALRAGVLAR